jgi:hypothetical protein
MSPIDLEYNDLEPDTAGDVPQHVLRFDGILERYNDGIEPINSWRVEDVAAALQCLHRELVERDAFMHIPGADGAE